MNRLGHAILCLLLFAGAATVRAADADELFRDGTEFYRDAGFARAADVFRDAAELRPASGTFQNLGNAEWQRGRVAEAVLAWERALWLDPRDRNARNNLLLARRTAILDPPELAWNEIPSTWLPAEAWAWLAGASLWGAVGLILLPGILRRPKAGWHQGAAACGFAVFLFCLPALFGVRSRTEIGFVMQRDTPLRLTPTQEAEPLTRLGAGEPARRLRVRGDFVFVRTSRGTGWVRKEQLGMVAGDALQRDEAANEPRKE